MQHNEDLDEISSHLSRDQPNTYNNNTDNTFHGSEIDTNEDNLSKMFVGLDTAIESASK